MWCPELLALYPISLPLNLNVTFSFVTKLLKPVVRGKSMNFFFPCLGQLSHYQDITPWWSAAVTATPPLAPKAGRRDRSLVSGEDGRKDKWVGSQWEGWVPLNPSFLYHPLSESSMNTLGRRHQTLKLPYSFTLKINSRKDGRRHSVRPKTKVKH